MTFYIFCAACGLCAALCLLFAADKLERRLLQARGRPYEASNKLCAAAVCTVFAALCVLACVREPPLRAAYLIGMFFLSLVITAMDWKYRLIPNDLVLLLLAVQCAGLLCGAAALRWESCLLGFVVAGVLFLIPAATGRRVGAGDVKLAAAIGFCTGLTGTLYAIALMGLMIMAFSYLQTMNLRLAMQKYVPMGPFISVAFVAILIY